MTVRRHPAILVRVRVVSDGEVAELFGIARVDADFAEASARAVLDAANVYVQSLLEGKHESSFHPIGAFGGGA